jgi:hypothetical protein
MIKIINKIALTIFLFLICPTNVRAGDLTSLQDVLSDSRSATSSDHSITFYTTNIIPVSGKVVITPSAGDFNIESGLSFGDIDFLVDNTQKTLGSSPGTGAGSAIGVSVTSGASGSIIFTLNDSDSIAGGALIELRIGSNTTSGGVGTKTIQLPTANGSYAIDLKTQNSSSVDIDTKRTMIFVAPAVGVSASNATPSPAPTPTPTPAVSPTPSPQGGGILFQNSPINVPQISSSTQLPFSSSNPSGSVYITGQTSTIIIAPSLVNSFLPVSVPLFANRENTVIFPIDFGNKLVVTIPTGTILSDSDQVVLVIRKIPKNEVSYIPLPVGRDIINGDIYKVDIYVDGLLINKLSKPIRLAFFYGDDVFLPEMVDIYHSGDKMQGWGVVKDVFRDVNIGFISAHKIYESGFFAIMGIRTEGAGLPSILPPGSQQPGSGITQPAIEYLVRSWEDLPLRNYSLIEIIILLILSVFFILLFLFLFKKKRSKK